MIVIVAPVYDSNYLCSSAQAWVSNLQAPTGSLVEFQRFIEAAQAAELHEGVRVYSETQPAKIRRRVMQVEPGDEEELLVSKQCMLCCEKPLKTIFANCGHMICCVECALKLKSSDCPMCRVPIDNQIIRVYGS